ncbi:MAG: cyclic nucleotide-binding domain-containing protein [Melioribacteraceae bacterium]|nr:cyclic nucleotide-binding domain-containing protein [Melioribacteraceae bacterium]
MENQLYIALESNKLFLDIDLTDLDLAEIQGDLQPLKEGEILYREEDSADKIFLVVSGEINLLKKKLLGSTKSFIFGENDFFGYDEIAEETSRTSTAVALRDSYLISLTKDELNMLLDQNHMIKTNLLNYSDIQPDIPGEKRDDVVDTDEEKIEPEDETQTASPRDKKTDVTSFEQSLKMI